MRKGITKGYEVEARDSLPDVTQSLYSTSSSPDARKTPAAAPAFQSPNLSQKPSEDRPKGPRWLLADGRCAHLRQTGPEKPHLPTLRRDERRGASTDQRPGEKHGNHHAESRRQEVGLEVSGAERQVEKGEEPSGASRLVHSQLQAP